MRYYKKAKEIIVKNRDKLDAITDLLLEKESIDAAQIDRILGIEPEKPVRDNRDRNPQKNRSRSNNPRRRPDHRGPRTDQDKSAQANDSKAPAAEKTDNVAVVAPPIIKSESSSNETPVSDEKKPADKPAPEKPVKKPAAPRKRAPRKPKADVEKPAQEDSKE